MVIISYYILLIRIRLIQAMWHMKAQQQQQQHYVMLLADVFEVDCLTK